MKFHHLKRLYILLLYCNFKQQQKRSKGVLFDTKHIDAIVVVEILIQGVTAKFNNSILQPYYVYQSGLPPPRVQTQNLSRPAIQPLVATSPHCL